MEIKMKICVFGASSALIDEVYIENGEHLGELMATRGHSLVFGAGAEGVMGAVVRGVHKHGGEITGVAPTFFNVDGILFEECTEMIRTETMRERKFIMEERAEAFIVAPGGIGTFEEFFEVLTLKQLGRHEKAIVVLNTNSYYDHMLKLIDHTTENKFMTEGCRNLFYVATSCEDALSYIESYKPQKYDIVQLRGLRNKPDNK